MINLFNRSLLGIKIPVVIKCKKMCENTGDRTWGHLASTEHYARPTTSEDYVLLKREDLSEPKYKDCMHASHCMIFARNSEKVFGVYHPRAAVLMQVRFDGYFGFPGGLVDSGENYVEGLNRELEEEMNLDLKKHKITHDHYVCSHYCLSKRLCLHFYSLELSMKELCDVEQNALLSKDYGEEVLGTIRVPLYTMGDGFRGFPVFLTNAFVGNSRSQLLHALKHFKILNESDISLALHPKNES